MAIGQITISAADWLASRVSDRMALVAAQQRTQLVQQGAAKAVPPAEQDAAAQFERRQRERSARTAQDAYRRIAARIKAQLASTAQQRLPFDPGSIRNAADRLAMAGNFRESPRIMATLLAAGHNTDPLQPVHQNQQPHRSDPVFGLAEADAKKARAAQRVSPGTVDADAETGARDKDRHEAGPMGKATLGSVSVPSSHPTSRTPADR